MSQRRITVRSRAFSLRVDLRVLGVLGVVGIATLLAFTLNIGRGEFAIAPLDVLATLVGAGDDATSFIVLDLRLPRALTAVLAGAALGIAGAIFQDLARNPLVAPDIIGITAGASLAAVALIVFGDVERRGVGSAGGSRRGRAHGRRAVRPGVARRRAGLSPRARRDRRGRVPAGRDLLRAHARPDLRGRPRLRWLVGSLNGRGWEHVWPLAATLAVLLPVGFALGRQLEVLQLGDDVARALGIGVERTRLALLAVAVVLTGVAVSASGPIAFVAFIAPHIARRVCATVSPSGILPVAAAAGALLVLCSDLAGRLLFAPTEIPVGIVTSIIAAPYFLFLLRRANRLGVTG